MGHLPVLKPLEIVALLEALGFADEPNQRKQLRPALTPHS